MQASHSHVRQYLQEAMEILAELDTDAIDRVIDRLAELQTREGRLFVLGVGGSAANASHLVNDFRKIAGIETYAPTDNVSELTARTNDEGWETVFVEWLKVSRLSAKDGLLVLSVGGGDREHGISMNLVNALEYAHDIGATIVGFVGRQGGYTAQVADEVVVVPTINPQHTTPHAEAFQGILWHLVVSDPRLKRHATKWESTAARVPA